MSLKTLREALCRHSATENLPPDVEQAVYRLVQRIDSHRPLGQDGSHDNRHTATCGCEDR